MYPPAILCLFLLSLSSLTPSPAAAGDDTPSVYDVLQQYDFPVGLLPTGVTSYDLDPSTGDFTVYLNETCSFTIDDYKLRYKSKVTGVISKDKLKNLSGISVKILFFWINISEVTRDDDELEFSVGIASADFSIDNFYECPQCGCGFDCNAIGEKKISGLGAYFNLHRYVSVS